MPEKYGKPIKGQNPRFLTQVEAEIAGIPRTREIYVDDLGHVKFCDPKNKHSKVLSYDQKIRATKKLEEFWEMPKKWREEREQ